MIRRLSKFKSLETPSVVEEDLKRYEYKFNPSVTFIKGFSFWALRCYSKSDNTIYCLIYILDDKDNLMKRINLNPYFQRVFGVRPADPKLFVLGDRVFCTLNSGHINEGENDVFILEIDPDGSFVTKKCFLEGKERIEKNWMFYEVGNKVFMIYSLSPKIKIFELFKVSKEAWSFIPYAENKTLPFPLSIGTPPLQVDGQILLFAHRKFFLRGKRLYLSIPVSFEHDEFWVKGGHNYYTHSYLSLFGERHKFNKNLFSCTYLSGLTRLDDEHVILSYGVNDHSMNIKVIPKNDLWE